MVLVRSGKGEAGLCINGGDDINWYVWVLCEQKEPGGEESPGDHMKIRRTVSRRRRPLRDTPFWRSAW